MISLHVFYVDTNLFLNQSSKTTIENTGADGIKSGNENDDKGVLLNRFTG